MVRQPQTRYARGPEGNLAYQIVGDGPTDLVLVPGWFSHVDLLWSDAGWTTFVGELASFARVIIYDKRGTSLSDPVVGVPTLESRVDDLRAVLDAAGSQRAALFGNSEGGAISVLLAATFPERVGALILYGSFANGSTEDDGTPARAKWIELMNALRASIDHWGEGRSIDCLAPSLRHSNLHRRAAGALERGSMSPGMALMSLHGHQWHVDVTDILGSVRVATLVLHRKSEAVPIEFGRELAEKIPGGCWYVGSFPLWWLIGFYTVGGAWMLISVPERFRAITHISLLKIQMSPLHRQLRKVQTYLITCKI